MKKLLMLLLLSSLACADSVLLKLPYGMELGKKVPHVVKEMALINSSYSTLYTVKNKFEFYIDSNNNISSILFFSNPSNAIKIPKLWRVLGLKISWKGGTEKSKILTIIKTEGAKNIIIDESPSGCQEIFKINFDIKKKYSYVITGGDEEGASNMSIKIYDEDEY